MQKSDVVIVRKIINSINDIISDTHGFTKETFIQNGLVKRACAMSLINVGELSRHLSDEFVSSNKSIPVNRIRGLRNAIAHGYESIDFDIIWDTIENDIPELKAKLDKFEI